MPLLLRTARQRPPQNRRWLPLSRAVPVPSTTWRQHAPVQGDCSARLRCCAGGLVCASPAKLDQSLAIMRFGGAKRVVEFAHISGMVLAVVDLHGDRINLWRQCRHIGTTGSVEPKGRGATDLALLSVLLPQQRYQYARADGSCQFDERSLLHKQRCVPLQCAPPMLCTSLR